VIDLLVVVARVGGGPIAKQMLLACERKHKRTAIFLTGEAAVLAGDSEYSQVYSNAVAAIVCAESWHSAKLTVDCLMELGSQTDHSRLVGDAEQIVSL